MALLVICAAGVGLGMAFDLFALFAALALTSPVALLTSVHVGLLGGLLNAVSISASLQVGYVLGLVSRQVFGTAFAVQATRLFPPSRRR